MKFNDRAREINVLNFNCVVYYDICRNTQPHSVYHASATLRQSLKNLKTDSMSHGIYLFYFIRDSYSHFFAVNARQLPCKLPPNLVTDLKFFPF